MKREARLLIAKSCGWGTLFIVTRGPSRIEHILPVPRLPLAEAAEAARRAPFYEELRAAHPREAAEALGLPHADPREALGACAPCVESLAESLCRELAGAAAGPREIKGRRQP